MSQTVQVGGSNYTIPDQGDPPNWGTNLTPFFVALAAEVATAPAFYQGVAVASTPITVGTEQTYLVSSNSITATLNLPAPVQNLWFAVKDSGKNAAVNNITIHRYGSEQINGVAADKVLSLSGGYWIFACNGTNWFMLRDVEALNPLKSTNQLVLTPGNGATTMTISAPAPAASNVITFPDLSTAWSVVGTQGTQSIGGAKTFSAISAFSAGFTSSAASSVTGGLTITDVSNQLVLGTTRTVTITAPTPASTSRTISLPDLSGDYSVLGTIGTQTITGIKTATVQMQFQTGIDSSGSIRIGADAAGTTVTNSTTKRGQIGVPHYTSASQADTCLVCVVNSSTANAILIGGGSTTLTAATEIDFVTASTTTNVSGGTTRMIIDTSGNVGIGTASQLINPDSTSATAVTIGSAVSGTGVPILALRGFRTSADAQYMGLQGWHGTTKTTQIYALRGSADDEGYVKIQAKQTAVGIADVASFKWSGVSILGTTTNDSASAGYVGEAVRSATSTGVSSPGTGQFFDIVNISLTAGDWDISGLVIFTLNGATSTVALMAITSTSGNSVTGQIDGDNRCPATVPVTANDNSASIPNYRVSLSGTTIYYLKARMDMSAGTPKAYGRISARRVR